jgi:alpha-L-fucosidase
MKKIKKNPAKSWFDEARFGMFIHWGLYSILARGEWVMFREKIPAEKYNKLIEEFNPVDFSPVSWAKLAKKAGAKYMVLTTRHHDGFCLYDSKVNSFNSMNSPAKRDFVAEYVEACREAGLRVGLYHSLMSWQHSGMFAGPMVDPAGWEEMVDESIEQVRELLTNYGKIDELWYDGSFVPRIHDSAKIAYYWRSRELNAMVRKLQPDILINNRSGLPEDFITPEQKVSPPPRGQRWEACMTINQSWGYNKTDHNFKSTQDIVQCLGRCARYGGNLLLNVGPLPDGSVQPECVEILSSVGEWLGNNGDAIYGSERSRYSEAEHAAGPVTCKGNKVYVHVSNWKADSIRLDGIRNVQSARFLDTDQGLEINNLPGGVTDVAGFNKLPASGLPKVLELELSSKPGAPADSLCGNIVPDIKSGDAPVLDLSDDYYSISKSPVITGDSLPKLLSGKKDIVRANGNEWCPGFAYPVFNCLGKPLTLSLKIPFDGKFDLELGIIPEQGGSLTADFSRELSELTKRMKNPGCPDTFLFKGLNFKKGNHDLRLSSKANFGLYAIRLNPCYSTLPTKFWQTIGPFPTRFGAQEPNSTVRDALQTVFPPEQEFKTDKKYAGAGNLKVGWKHTKTGRGDHAESRVNFAYLCGIKETGVCYARTVITSPVEREIEILLGCDWWANIFVNGTLIKSSRDPKLCREDGAQFNAWKPTSARVKLNAGENVVLIKNHCGRGANWFTFYITDPGDLKVSSTTS